MVAAALLLLLSLAAAAATTTSDSSGTPYRERSEEEMRRIFTEWSANYRKTDTSAAEEERRYALFKRRLRRFDQQNDDYPALPGWAWTNKRSEEEMRRIFTDWSAEQGISGGSEFDEGFMYDRFCHYLQRIDLHWHNAGYPAWSWDRERSEEEAQRIFVEWKARNGKTYSSIAEEEHRYATFKDALREVDRHNVGYTFGVHDSIVGISNLADLTHEEIKVVDELRA
ncbi:hypothetical protein QYE76_036848 [Lolium multiflorum]|uniref:Cathepsin propeptide inhibitor domain-containing protein n=1 Tax=Lolium multiflorum TaxID=4521 RepID=A0AAD8VQC3_LOLMU|nr:hypothetical protein QYE76_036848 [Lolium multiflorum]